MVHLVLNVKVKYEEKVSCEICNKEMIEGHCKLLCLNCGFMWDCSDH